MLKKVQNLRGHRNEGTFPRSPAWLVVLFIPFVLECGGSQSPESSHSGMAEAPSQPPSQTVSQLGPRPQEQEIEQVLTSAQDVVRTCTSTRTGAAAVDMVVRGSDGMIVSANVVLPSLTPPESQCVAKALQKVRFQPFGRDKFYVTYPFALGGSLNGYVGTAGSRGTMSPATIEQQVMSHAGQLRECYDDCCSTDPDATGSIEVQFTISPAGRVESSIIIKSTLGHPDMDECILSIVRGWNFPKPDGGEVVVRYPLRFYPAE